MEHPVDVQQCHSCACVFAHINAFIALVTLRYVPHPSIDSRSHASLSLGHVGLLGRCVCDLAKLRATGVAVYSSRPFGHHFVC
jgi:hypothetical protein